MKVLYMCTHNRCRSILCEAITNHLADGIIEARSAGSHPAGVVHPLTLKYLSLAGIPTDNLHSKSWDEMEHFSPDLVVTVCDAAAGEACPIYFGDSLKVHWGLQDPSALEGSEEEKRQAFIDSIHIITSRTNRLLELIKHTSDIGTLHAELDKIGTKS